MSRSIHQIPRKSCDSTCVCGNDNFYADGPVNTTYNIYNGKTSKSGIFPTPGTAGTTGTLFSEYYQSGGSSPVVDPAVFFTSIGNPVTIFLFVTPADLAKAAVFLFTEFTTTDIDGNTTSWLSNDYIISIEQPGQSTSLPNKSTDTPIPTFSGFMFGSFDKMLMEIFNKSNVSFKVLTNPNELLLGSPNRVQIIWPEGTEWSLSFLAPQQDSPNNYRLYTYTSSPAMLSYITVNSNFQPTSTISVIVGSGEVTTFSVFDEPMAYVMCRQPFDLSYPPSPPVCFDGYTGITGVTGDISTGQACITSFVIDSYIVPIDTKCLCIPFYREDQGISGIGSRVNGTKLVEVLNAMFFKSRVNGWQAVQDTFYPYVRIIHPDHILSYSITIRKRFYKSNGLPNICFDELLIFRQGALTENYSNSPIDGSTLVETNINDLMDGLSWCSTITKQGCFMS